MLATESTRIKLYIAKNRIEKHSECSDAYIRIYNRSLRENYRLWLRIEKKVLDFIHYIFADGKRHTKVVRWIGTIGLRMIQGISDLERRFYYFLTKRR